MGLLRRRDRRVLAADRGVVDLGSDHRGDRRQRARDGPMAATSRARVHPPCGQRRATHQLAVRSPTAPGRAPGINRQSRVQRRQRTHRKLLVDYATGTPGPNRLGPSDAGRIGDSGADRGVSTAPPGHRPRRPQPCRRWSHSHRSQDRGMINSKNRPGSRVRLRSCPHSSASAATVAYLFRGGLAASFPRRGSEGSRGGECPPSSLAASFEFSSADASARRIAVGHHTELVVLEARERCIGVSCTSR